MDIVEIYANHYRLVSDGPYHIYYNKHIREHGDHVKCERASERVCMAVDLMLQTMCK